MKTNAHLSDHISERERKHQALALEIATEGIVLLANAGTGYGPSTAAGRTLPMAPCPIALYGAGAAYTIKGGSGSGEVNVRHSVTVQEGLEEAGFEVVTGDWIGRYDKLWRSGKEAFLRTMRRELLFPTARVLSKLMESSYHFPSGDRLTQAEVEATGVETCIYVLSRQSGEGHDCSDTPGSFRPDETEIHNIRLCAEHFKRFVLVINSGNPLDLTPLETLPETGAIVYMGQLGMEGGRALAAVLTGKVTPSGKLAVSWPQRYSDVPFGNEFAQDPNLSAYKEGMYVGYRYYDSFAIAPRYPFGYGLSYASFTLTPDVTSLDKDIVRCAIRVTNSSRHYAGKEVVQLYARCPGAEQVCRQLVAFAKTRVLAPGETATVQLAFSVHDLARYDASTAQTVLPAGRYLLCAGCSSRDNSPLAVVDIAKDYVLCQHRNLCAVAGKVSELSSTNNFAIPAGLPELRYAPTMLATRVIDYSTPAEPLPSHVSKRMEGFTAADYIRFCTGTGMSGEKRGFRTPGAVGHTTTAYIARGIPNAEMCDGPAGIRLERRAVQYPDGDIRAVDLSISVYEFFPRLLLNMLVLGNPAKGKMLYQFVTGFPIAAVVAQTWNTPLAERMGQAVSDEMNEYGVSYWLAPAMNIVRNPLCGRNYEYLSEDPLITGKMAAAITRGAQRSPLNNATIKHFCANSQEADRYSISSEVDERVLREIYWRGFEIAVREAHPRAIMTAYNRLNGTYCANSRELCTDLLRREWGFDGVVMTDWMSTGKDRASEAEAIRAGVDIIMPGGKKELKALTQAYSNGRLTIDELRRAAARVISSIVHE